ncbi:hypothetical protein [Psychrobacter namhaensis]|uniref:hypothetical protein n=1 Tax=Psychrobacter namhaensis TaxID=292734 RepID=UPI0018DF47E7|nr:hypothetical protein [Psychrobacter namhaensis]
MANEFVQTMADARVDAQSLSDFVFKPSGFKVARRLAPTIDTLQFYINRFNSLNGDFSSSVSVALSSLNSSVAEADGKVAYIETTVQDAINNTAVEGGVLADTFVTATANGIGQVARNQREKNADRLTPYDFGVVGNLNIDKLSDRFTTLDGAKEQYPNAVSLDELADRVALDAFLLYLIANRVDGADWSCEILLDQPLVSYREAKTLLISGSLVCAPLMTNTNKLSYCLHIATNQVVCTGTFNVQGNSAFPDMRSRKIVHGIIFGAYNAQGTELTGNASNCEFNLVVGSHLLGMLYVFGANCHFSCVKQARGSNCGSARVHDTYPYLQGINDTFTSTTTVGGSLEQRSILTIPDMIYTPELHSIAGQLVKIGGEPYAITDYDYTAKTLTIYPNLPTGVTTGRVDYIFGGVYSVNSANTACTRADTVQAIVCGIGVHAPSLYGTNVGNLITEYNGCALHVGERATASIGNIVNLAYFEANSFDIVYGWLQDNYNALTILQNIALNKDKIWNLAAYRMSGVRRRDWSVIRAGSISVGTETLTLESTSKTYNLLSESHNKVVFTNTASITLSYDNKIAELTQRNSKTLFFAAASSAATVLTINAPTGFTINNLSSVTINLSDYNGVVTAAFWLPLSLNSYGTNITMQLSGVRKVTKGATAQRPTAPALGDRYYDTTLLAAGKPISWNGTAWVDALGATV